MNAFNVWSKANGPLTMTQEELDSLGSAGVRMAQETIRKNDERRGSDSWRTELDELSRRLKGLPSTEAAESNLASLLSAAKAYEKEIEVAVDQAEAAMKTPFLSAFEQSELARKAASLGDRLADFRKNNRVKLAQAKALVETAREWNPKRPRYEELRKRAAEIDKAMAKV